MTQGFVGSGMQQERKRDLEKSANERLGRLVTDSYLPQIKNILQTYDIGEEQLKETYGFRASALERTKDLEAGRLTEDKEAALNALETEFGVSLEDIGIAASDVIDSALREQQAGEFDAIARQNRLREEERNLDNRKQQQIAGLLTEEETAQLRKDEALFAIEQQTEDSLSSATTLLDDYIGSILEQYDALPEPEDKDDDDDDTLNGRDKDNPLVFDEKPEAPEGFPFSSPPDCPTGVETESTTLKYVVGMDKDRNEPIEETVTYWAECPETSPDDIDLVYDTAFERYGDEEGTDSSTITYNDLQG